MTKRLRLLISGLVGAAATVAVAVTPAVYAGITFNFVD
jgi:hypothetical protein